jgi:hypothetical protein
MCLYQSNHLRYLGVLSCNLGGSPPFFLRKDSHSLASKSRALSGQYTRLNRKCVTLINRLRFLCSHILCLIELLLLPIYTTVPLNSNSYAPASGGTLFASSSLNLRILLEIGTFHLPIFRSFYTHFKIDNNHLSMLTLAKGLGGLAWANAIRTTSTDYSMLWETT